MNLRDRMSSEQLASETQESDSLKNSSSLNTTVKSSQPSQMELIQKQSETINSLKGQLSQEREMHRSELENQDKMIQNLSSEISMLKKTVRQKSETIVSLNDKLAKLNDSDLLLKEAEAKEKQNASIRKEAEDIKVRASKEVLAAQKDRDEKVKEANERVDRIKADAKHKIERIRNQCQEDNDAAKQNRDRAETLYKDRLQLLNNQEAIIEKKADEKIETYLSEMRIRETNFNTKTKAYYKNLHVFKESSYAAVFIFCIVYLVIEAVTSAYFRDCCVCIATWIADTEKTAWATVQTETTKVCSLAAGIENQDFATFVCFILLIFIGTMLFVVLCAGLPALITLFTVLYLRSPKFDKAAKWIMVGSGIFAVSLATEPFHLMTGQNIIIWWLVVQIAVPVIRFFIYPLLQRLVKAISEKAKQSYVYYDSEERKRRVVAAIVVIGSIAFGFLFLFVIMPKLYTC